MIITICELHDTELSGCLQVDMLGPEYLSASVTRIAVEMDGLEPDYHPAALDVLRNDDLLTHGLHSFVHWDRMCLIITFRVAVHRISDKTQIYMSGGTGGTEVIPVSLNNVKS